MTINTAPSRVDVLEFIKISQGSQFVIPVYQRNYTWKPKVETLKLLNDFENTIESNNKHFLGIVMYLAQHGDIGYQELSIIDGQQRVTTIFLMLLALKSLAEENGKQNIVGIIDDFYLYNKYTEDKNKFRMKPLVSDNDVFKKLLENKKDSITLDEQESLVFENYNYIFNRFKALANTYELQKLLNSLSNFYIVSIPLINSDNPQQIFESINSTGAPLTSADLIRNYVLMKYNADQQDILYNNHWRNIEQSVPDSRKLEDIIRQFLASQLYFLPSKKDIYTEFKNWWEDSTEEPEIKIDLIYKYINYYNYIYHSDKLDIRISEAILNFRKTSSKMPASFLLEILNLFEEKLLSFNQVNELFTIINTYLVRRWLGGLNTNSITTLFPSLLKNVLDHSKEDFRDISDVTIYYLVNSNIGKKRNMPTDEYLREELKNIDAYSNTAIRAVLETIENHNNPAPVDFNALNIEHIMPQTSTSYWRDITGLTELEYSMKSNLIGNLTLASSYDNSKMGNSNFEKKKNILRKTSHLKLNEEILKLEIWNEDSIDERTNTLIDSIIEIYPYFTTSYTKAVDDELELFLNSEKCHCKAKLISRSSIIVLPGSTFSYYEEHSTRNTLTELKDELLEQNIIVHKDNRFVFEKDYEFNSLSQASSFVLGYNSNGKEEWKLEDGTSINQYELMNQNG